MTWGSQRASVARAGLLRASEDATYTRKEAPGAPFTVRAVMTKPSSEDLTGGISAELQKIKVIPSDFKIVSGGILPRKGDLIELGGITYQVERFVPVRRAGADMVYNLFCAG